LDVSFDPAEEEDIQFRPPDADVAEVFHPSPSYSDVFGDGASTGSDWGADAHDPLGPLVHFGPPLLGGRGGGSPLVPRDVHTGGMGPFIVSDGDPMSPRPPVRLTSDADPVALTGGGSYDPYSDAWADADRTGVVFNTSDRIAPSSAPRMHDTQR